MNLILPRRYVDTMLCCGHIICSLICNFVHILCIFNANLFWLLFFLICCIGFIIVVDAVIVRLFRMHNGVYIIVL